MGITNVFTSQPETLQTKLHWDGGFSLWDISRHKVTGITILEILGEMATDDTKKKVYFIGFFSVE